jgi:PTH1 family peptidyl-tRNA hydrolase
MDNLFLIVGLGNIGSQYEKTRHNIGFRVVDALAAKYGGIFVDARLGAVSKIRIKNKTIVLVKPSTYMNLSGKTVKYWLNELKLTPEQMMVVVDDLALPVGALRMRTKGSDAGHNGLKSIQELLGNNLYPRLRFGIGDNFAKGQQAEFVLSKFDVNEEKILSEKIEKACEMLESFVHQGIEKTMSQHNQ